MEKADQKVLFISDQGGYSRYRAPGMIRTSAGEILVYCEARAADPGVRFLLMRRSCDGGRSFSPAEILVRPSHGEMLHNLLLLSAAGGRVIRFWCADYRFLYLSESADGGHSWGSVRDLTPVLEEYRSRYPWTMFAASCTHGIETSSGMLLVPLWLTTGIGCHYPACFASLYSTDGGRSWQLSDPVPGTGTVVDPTEAAIAECPDGSFLATLRHGARDTRRRAFVRGTGTDWDTPWLNRELPDPICAGSLISLPDGTLIFSNCAYGDEPCLARIRSGESVKWSPDARQRLTLRSSGDSGLTWSGGLMYAAEGGYSDLASSSDGRTIYCFYEQGWIRGDSLQNRTLSFLAVPAADIP